MNCVSYDKQTLTTVGIFHLTSLFRWDTKSLIIRYVLICYLLLKLSPLAYSQFLQNATMSSIFLLLIKTQVNCGFFDYIAIYWIILNPASSQTTCSLDRAWLILASVCLEPHKNRSLFNLM